MSRPTTDPAHPTPARPRVRTIQPLLREVYGRLLRRLRQRQGRTLAAVAAEAGISMAYLSEIERGLKEPSSEILAAVCGALDATILGLVGAAHEELREVQELRVVPTTRSVLAAATSVVPTRSGGAVLLAA